MRIIGRQFLVAAAIGAIALSSPAAADVESGISAWKRGDYAAAIAEWRPLAEKGDPDAQFNMGQAYALGHGVPTDLKLAQSWYEKAAQQGHEDAQANLGLALFQNGDRAAALPWIKKAADRGDPRAQYILGTMLFNADILAKDWPRAYALMSRAAAQGLPPAQSSLTDMNNFLSPAEREQGLAMAKAMASQQGPAASASAGAAPKPLASADGAPARTLPPASRLVDRATQQAPVPHKPAPAVTRATAAPVAGKWRIQLGAFGSQDNARRQWEAARARVPALATLQPLYGKAGALTRLQAGPVASRAAADKVCAAAKAAGLGCFPVAP